ncbi:hypothetical protein COLO4_34029 [Corchorus olitorius]|uniref:Uncharacterized protein n=1 Tax=Corchorus olitorius TaxID=93759 RepID=A0A1R3GP25_9ROSI|nr:hypothetical protein COLO4_34029 [Corchorus olitorius]
MEDRGIRERKMSYGENEEMIVFVGEEDKDQEGVVS